MSREPTAIRALLRLKAMACAAALLACSSAFAQVSSSLGDDARILGVSVDAFLARYPFSTCDAKKCQFTRAEVAKSVCPHGLDSCPAENAEKLAFGHAALSELIALKVANKIGLIRAQFPTDQYPVILATLTRTYGAPATTVEDWVTDYGPPKRELPSKRSMWRNDGNEIILRERGDFVGSTALSIQASWFYAEMAKEAAAAGSGAPVKVQ